MSLTLPDIGRIAHLARLELRVAVREFLRVRGNAEGGLDPFPKQGSGVLSSCAWAEGFVSNPPGQVIQPGDIVQFIPLEA